MNRSQISSQVFIYVMAAVIVAVVLFVGAKAIRTIIEAGSSVSIDDFKNDLTGKVNTVSRQYGSVSKFSFTLNDKFEEICFSDSRNEEGVFSEDLKTNAVLASYPFVKDHIDADAEGNVFLMKNKLIEDRIEVEGLDVEQDFLCIENQGLMDVWLKGSGKYALLYVKNE